MTVDHIASDPDVEAGQKLVMAPERAGESGIQSAAEGRTIAPGYKDDGNEDESREGEVEDMSG